MDFDSSIERAKTNKVTSLVFTLKPIFFFLQKEMVVEVFLAPSLQMGNHFASTMQLQVYRYIERK